MIREYLPADVRVNSPLEGMFPALVARVFERALQILPQYRVDLAIEGADRMTHEKVRPGSWDTTWETAKVLDKLNISWQWEMTIYPENYHQIANVYSLTGGNVYINFGRYSTRFGNQTQGLNMWPDQAQLDVIEDQLTTTGWLTKRPANEQKWRLQRAMWEGKKVRWDCGYGRNSIDVQPNGDVYPCLQYPAGMVMGSLKHMPLHIILTSAKARLVTEDIARHKCQTGPGCPFTLCLWADNINITEGGDADGPDRADET
jgi:radical SAM protein with 4Fe4S-binding SPASM domain